MVDEEYYGLDFLEENNPCTKCKNWEQFKHECWFYWEHKKQCSQRLE